MNNINKFKKMRPKSTAADISREIRGWSVLAIATLCVTAAVYVAVKGKEMAVDVLGNIGGTKKKEGEFDEVS